MWVIGGVRRAAGQNCSHTLETFRFTRGHVNQGVHDVIRLNVVIMPLPLVGGRLGDDAVWRLSVAYIRPKSRTERPKKNKIGTEVAHATRDSGTIFKVKRSKVKVTRPLYSPRRLHIRQLQRWAWESIDCGNLPLRFRLQARRSAGRREALRRPQKEGVGGISWRPPRLQLVLFDVVNICRFDGLLPAYHCCP